MQQVVCGLCTSLPLEALSMSRIPGEFAHYCEPSVQVVVGGGQEASQVTTTAGKAGRFESRFFHKVRWCTTT